MCLPTDIQSLFRVSKIFTLLLLFLLLFLLFLLLDLLPLRLLRCFTVELIYINFTFLYKNNVTEEPRSLSHFLIGNKTSLSLSPLSLSLKLLSLSVSVSLSLSLSLLSRHAPSHLSLWSVDAPLGQRGANQILSVSR